MRKFNCMCTHCCEEKVQLCCSFCHKTDCEWRCLDEPKSCIYKDIDQIEEQNNDCFTVKEDQKVRHHNELVDNKIRDLLKEYAKENHLNAAKLAQMTQVKYIIIRKLLGTNPIIKIRSNYYNLIKDFVKTIKEQSK